MPGVRPPIRLVTAQRNGPTSRSDKYLMRKMLQDIQNEYCIDLVKDTTDALLRLNDWTPREKSQPFALDAVALYDSVSPVLAIEALDCALRQCRSEWSDEFRDWIKGLVKHTIFNNKFMYRGNWYSAKNGIPTGGVLSPLLANITMTYVLRNVLFDHKDDLSANPPGLQGIVCFIDDLGGRWVGPTDQFHTWVQ